MNATFGPCRGRGPGLVNRDDQRPETPTTTPAERCPGLVVGDRLSFTSMGRIRSCAACPTRVIGVTTVFRLNPERFELLATNDLGEPSNATPAISDGQIFLRTDAHLYCIGTE